MSKPFVLLYLFFKDKKALLFGLLFAVFGLLGWFASKVKYSEDISKVLPNDKSLAAFQDVFSKTKVADKIAVRIFLTDSNLTDPDALVDFAESLNLKLKQSPSAKLISEINYRASDSLMGRVFDVFYDNLPVFLEPKDYQKLDSAVLTERISLSVQKAYHTLNSPASMAVKSYVLADPLGISGLAFKRIQALAVDENYVLYDGCYLTKDYKNLLFFIQPNIEANNSKDGEKLLQTLESALSEVTKTYEGKVQSEYFGGLAVAVANAKQIRQDIILTVSLTVIGILLVFFYFLRSFTAPIILLLPVAFGMGFALAAVYLVQGEISIISVAAGSIIIGIAIDFSIHFFTHHKHTGDPVETIQSLSLPLTLGCFTTVAAFFSLTFVESPILHDFGLFSGWSIIGAALFCLIFMPHIVGKKAPESSENLSAPSKWLEKLSALRPDKSKWVLGIMAILTIILGVYSSKVGFESDLLSINYMPDHLAKSEANLNALNSQTLRSVLLVTKGKTFDEAVLKAGKSLATISGLKNDGIIKKYTSVAEIIVSDSSQKARIEKWNSYWTSERKSFVKAALAKSAEEQGFSETAFSKFNLLLDKSFEPLSSENSSFIKKAYFNDLVSETDSSCTIISNARVRLEDKATVFSAFANQTDIGIVDKQYVTTQLVAIVNRDFTWIAGVSSIIVFLTLLVSYGRIELALVTFVPMFISWLWILGIMAIFGIQFNIVNIIISTFIFGLGDDYSIFVTDGLLQEYKTGKKVLTINKSAVFLSALSTVIGLGVLILAKHPALKSIALISIIGMVCVVLTSYTLIPFFFRIIIGDRAEKGLVPYTAKSFLVTIFTFVYFVAGCLLLNLIAFIFFSFSKSKNGRPNALLCQLLYWTSNSLVFGTFTIKKKILNPHKETFDSPAIIIANHQSFLDILFTVMLHPKIILVTNDWVWNSPVFGFVIRKAGYFAASNGVENNFEALKAKIDAGFSIVIFPEGTRSVDGSIHRFHKGAFFLAEALKADIVPIVFHGTGDCVQKGDSFIVKDGTITLKIEKRIKADDPVFGNSYSEKTKAITKYYRAEYENLRLEYETPDYFHQKVLSNFIYKGPELEWYVRIKLLLEKNYNVYNQLVPKVGQITDIGCGYGYMDFMLSSLSKDRIITAIDHDHDKIEVAQHSYGRHSRLNFYASNILEFELPVSDAFIISDVLHYLSESDQIMLLERCAAKLNANGKIIIRDGDADLKERHKNTKMTEVISTNVGFNKTMPDKQLHFISGTWLKGQAENLSLKYDRIDSSKRTSNVFYILEK